jgi:hypothetical protein
MLLTFQHFGEVPGQVHLFYEQAFSALFSRHDATKEAFKRKHYTDFFIDEFKRYFSLFCLITYLRKKTLMSEADVFSVLADVSKIEKTPIDRGAFLNDLTKSVCILRPEGTDFTFVHRSFQEYFAAYWIARHANDNAGEVMGRVASRLSDNVLTMAWSMNRELVTGAFLIPQLREYRVQTWELAAKFSVVEYMRHFEGVGFLATSASTGECGVLMTATKVPVYMAAVVFALTMYPRSSASLEKPALRTSKLYQRLLAKGLILETERCFIKTNLRDSLTMEYSDTDIVDASARLNEFIDALEESEFVSFRQTMKDAYVLLGTLEAEQASRETDVSTLLSEAAEPLS